MKNDKKSRSTCLLGGDPDCCEDCIYGADYHYVDGECVERDQATRVKEIAKELCEKSGCHHKCHDTKDCVVEDEAKTIINSEFDINSTDGLINGTSTNTIIADKPRLLLINENKSNNFDVKSNEELFKQALVEGVNRHIDKTIDKEKQIEEIAKYLCKSYSPYCSMCPDCYAEEEATALYNAGYRKHTDRFLAKENGEIIPLLPKQSEGHWIENEDDFWVMCSECGTEFLDDQIGIVNTYNYCPFCGAKMKGGEE